MGFTNLVAAAAYGVIGVSGCGFVLVDEAVENSSPSDPVGREIGWRRLEWLGRPMVKGPMGPEPVVVRQVLGEYCSQVTYMVDEQSVGAFAAQGADPAFTDRVCLWCLDGSLDGCDASAWKTASKLGVYLASRSRSSAGKPIIRFRACWVPTGRPGAR